MSYKKFDDPNTKVNAAVRKMNDAFPKEEWRRALQGLTNRVIGGSNGTQGPLITAGCALGTTAGFKIANALTVVIDGVQSSVIAQDNLLPAEGTMGTNTVAKYLICTSTGTSGTVIGPGNIILKSDYASTTLAAAAAKLPDLPDGYCALGYVTYNAPEATAPVFINTGGFIMGTGGTAGTAAYVDLVCMPYDL